MIIAHGRCKGLWVLRLRLMDRELWIKTDKQETLTALYYCLSIPNIALLLMLELELANICPLPVEVSAEIEQKEGTSFPGASVPFLNLLLLEMTGSTQVTPWCLLPSLRVPAHASLTISLSAYANRGLSHGDFCLHPMGVFYVGAPLSATVAGW